MVKRLLDLRQHVTTVCEEQGIDNIKNWRNLVQLIQVLEPFSRWIDFLQGEKYATIAHALPCANELLEHLSDMINKNILEKLCKKIVAEIRGPWKYSHHRQQPGRFNYILSPYNANFDSIFIIATSLHPTLALSMDEQQPFRARQGLLVLMKTESNNAVDPIAIADTGSTT